MQMFPADTWMKNVMAGRWRFTLESEGFGTYGGRYGAWGRENHRLDRHIFYCITKGCMSARWEGGEALLESGTAFWLAPNVPHTFSLPQNRPFSVFHARLDVRTPRDAACLPPFSGRAFPHGEKLRYVFEDLIANEHSRRSDRAFRRRALLLLLFSEFFEEDQQSGTTRAKLTPAQQRAIEGLAAGTRHQFLRPVELANEVDLSPEYFARLFRATYGTSPRDWIVRQRIKSAATILLESNASIGEVARMHGYPDLYFFSRQFARVMRLSPREFRRRGEAK